MGPILLEIIGRINKDEFRFGWIYFDLNIKEFRWSSKLFFKAHNIFSNKQSRSNKDKWGGFIINTILLCEKHELYERYLGWSAITIFLALWIEDIAIHIWINVKINKDNEILIKNINSICGLVRDITVEGISNQNKIMF